MFRIINDMVENNLESMISVLIPAYNVQGKLDKMFESLINQTCKLFNVLIIDDGSVDSTFEIIQKYTEKYSFIHGLTQKNRGVAYTRQRLIELCETEFFIFCDADDYLDIHTIQWVNNVIKSHEVDIVIWGYRLVRQNGEKVILRRQLEQGEHVKIEWEKLHVQGLADLYWSSYCNKCYRKSVYAKPEKIKYQTLMEDVCFNIEYLSRCTKMYVLEKALYNYVQIGTSLTRIKQNDKREDISDALELYSKMFILLNLSYTNEKNENAVYILNRFLWLIDRAKRINDNYMVMEIKKSPIFNIVKSKCGVRVIKVYRTYYFQKLKTIIKKVMTALRG